MSPTSLGSCSFMATSRDPRRRHCGTTAHHYIQTLLPCTHTQRVNTASKQGDGSTDRQTKGAQERLDAGTGEDRETADARTRTDGRTCRVVPTQPTNSEHVRSFVRSFVRFKDSKRFSTFDFRGRTNERTNERTNKRTNERNSC